MQISSATFVALSRAQARALGYSDLPIAVVPHPFETRTRAQLREIAEKSVEDIARYVCEADAPEVNAGAAPGKRAGTVEVADDVDEINRLFRERRWTDGFPVVAPTADRVRRMLRCASQPADELIATVAPGMGAATVQRIAVNAVMAGCDPEYMPVLIAAVKALTAPEFNLQSIQVSTNPAGVWLIVNGPVARRLDMNDGVNCLGHGNWANATLGRALRLVMQNIGGALSGEMDRATHGQPGKYTFCCAESEVANPWEPLHVERGFRREQSTVTVVAAEGTQNINTHAKTANDLLRIFADAMQRPAGNDYWIGGEPWIVMSPWHANILKAAGLTKSEVKYRVWEESKIPASRMDEEDREHTQVGRRAELGAISLDTMLPISRSPGNLGIIVAGGAGTHSLYVPSFGNTRSVTLEVN